MYLKNFWKETVVAGGIAFGGSLLVVGFRLMGANRPYRSQAADQLAYLGVALIGIGSVIAIASFLLGLAIVIGIGPGRLKTGATVEERLSMMSDGSPIFDEVPDGVPVRHYLRLRMADGEVIEARCSREVFHACPKGTVGDAKVSGERLISFVRTGRSRV